MIKKDRTKNKIVQASAVIQYFTFKGIIKNRKFEKNRGVVALLQKVGQRYCRVILIGKQGDKDIKTTLYTIYKDVFVKENGKWLISHRTSNFVHREVETLQ